MRTHKTDMQNNFTKCQNVETHAFSHQTLMHLYAVADELKYNSLVNATFGPGKKSC